MQEKMLNFITHQGKAKSNRNSIHYTLTRTAKIKRQKRLSFGEVMEQPGLIILLVKCIGTTIMENWQHLQLSNSAPRYISQRNVHTHAPKDMHKKFTAALVLIAKCFKFPQMPINSRMGI